MGPSHLGGGFARGYPYLMIRTGRLVLSALLALAFASASWAAPISMVPEMSLAPIGVPAIILGGPTSLPPPLSAALKAQTLTVASLPPALVAPFLIERAAAATPVERAAAKIIAASLANNPGTSAGKDPGVQQLALSAKEDPALAGWFDGGQGGGESLGLDGLTLKRGAWRLGEKTLDRLGQGEFGFVDVHPTIEGAVIKTVEHSAEIHLMSTQSPKTTAAGEKASAELLSSIDAGPRWLGGAIIGGRIVSVRERVYGDTLEGLLRGKFTADDEALILDLLRRMSGAGVATNDLRSSNIMIGRTLLDPRRRAYVVDGGSKVEYPEGLDAQARFTHLLNMPVVIRGRFDMNVGFVEYVKSLRAMMDEGLERASRVTRWQKFKGFFKDIRFTP